MELRNAVAKAFSIPVPASVAFDYPTLEDLASYIGNKLAARATLTKPASAVVSLPHQHQASMTTEIVSVACQYPAAEATGKAFCPELQCVSYVAPIVICDL